MGKARFLWTLYLLAAVLGAVLALVSFAGDWNVSITLLTTAIVALGLIAIGLPLALDRGPHRGGRPRGQANALIHDGTAFVSSSNGPVRVPH
jgi:predicted permease